MKVSIVNGTTSTNYIYSALFIMLGLTFCFSLVKAQTPRVPTHMEIGGLKLTIKESARKKIQDDVDALHKYPDYFNKKLIRAEMYLPIIERIFAEEGVPDDLKFLVIQESALIPDAVSKSNAIGFWQFKIPAAKEVGLRTDRQVDERMNIVSSSRGAARYLKKNNFYFDNWIYAVMAYQTGRGGAEQYVENRYKGADRMDITGDTYWYVLKYLAHKVAYESHLYQSPNVPYYLREYETNNQNLRQVADKFKVDEELLKEYNKWLKTSHIPADKNYTVIVPIDYDELLASDRRSTTKYKSNTFEHSSTTTKQQLIKVGEDIANYNNSTADLYPIIKEQSGSGFLKINEIVGVKAGPNDSFTQLCLDANLSMDKFMKYNDLTRADEIVVGQVYYFSKKRTKANTYYHTVQPGETLWAISQKYGVRLDKLKDKNRLRSEADISAGLVLWLRYIRPRDEAPQYQQVKTTAVVSNVAKPATPKIEKPTPKPIMPEPVAVETATPVSAPVEVEEEEYMEENISSASETTNKIPEGVIIIDTIPEENEIVQTVEEPKKVKEIPEKHIIAQGETLHAISRMYNIHIDSIFAWNEQISGHLLHIGQEINLRPNMKNEMIAEAPVQLKTITHVVKPQDTLFKISKLYGVTVEDILEWNEKKTADIDIDEELKIYTN